ncbi:MAG: hypothetical protein LBD68_06160 [Zoogloeaceae bacterium]|jgi:hypothetical protein|nr:hypothetical protein [Zoogloeaceae bacterium]
MTDKYLARVAGKTKRQSAIATSAGVTDAGRIAALNSEGKLDVTLLPSGIGANVFTATAKEALSAGAFVNLFADAGVFSARLADNTNGRSADGFVSAATPSGNAATIYPLGEVNANLSGLAVGNEYWLGITGGVIATPLDEDDDGNDGYISQHLGKAKSATELVTVRDDPVIL